MKERLKCVVCNGNGHEHLYNECRVCDGTGQGDTITDAEIIESLARLDATGTPAPWRAEQPHDDVYRCDVLADANTIVAVLECNYDEQDGKDAALIAAMRNALPRLLILARVAGLQDEALKQATAIAQRAIAERDRLLAALKLAAIAEESIHNHAAPLAPGCFNDYEFGDVTIRVGCRPGTDEEAPCLFAEEVQP